jgi:hypothetical protein
MTRNLVLLLATAAILWFAASHVATQDTQAQPATRGLDAFDRIAAGLQGPRCLNCHPRGDRPKQGDDRHVHLMNVQRGVENMGVPAMRCATCHQTHNNDMAGIPGAPDWHLAPASMGWDGLSKSELCRTLLDPTKNGGRSVQHMTDDKLVLWAWNPGRGGTPPVLSIDDFKIALDQWAAARAPCPN